MKTSNKQATEETSKLLSSVQSSGVSLVGKESGVSSRHGGAGPSDHKAMTIDGRTLMIPILSKDRSTETEYTLEFEPSSHLTTAILRSKSTGSQRLVTLPSQPKFYQMQTLDGIPYKHIAVLHGKDVLATTILQNCIRYTNRNTSCQFCSIGSSLKNGQTIAHKTPEQLAEVAKAAVLLDGVKHMVMTTGTPNTTDRGASILCDSAKGVKKAVNLPIQAQCEPPNDDIWFSRLKDAGVDSLGMHIEVISKQVRERIMPGKAKVPLSRYYEAFKSSIKVFGRGQVSTYILAGLGDSTQTILDTCDKLIEIGVYPFVVPFVPIAGTPLENHPSPTSDFMNSILKPLAQKLQKEQLLATDIKAGCGRCGACSTLSTFEVTSHVT